MLNGRQTPLRGQADGRRHQRRSSLGQMHHVDHLTVTGGNHTAFDQVLQLTNIAGKPISEQRVTSRVLNPASLRPWRKLKWRRK